MSTSAFDRLDREYTEELSRLEDRRHERAERHARDVWLYKARQLIQQYAEECVNYGTTDPEKLYSLGGNLDALIAHLETRK